MALDTTCKLRKEDEKRIKRLLALEVFGEEAIEKAESRSKQVYEIVVNGKKKMEELIVTKTGVFNGSGKMVFALKPEFSHK